MPTRIRRHLGILVLLGSAGAAGLAAQDQTAPPADTPLQQQLDAIKRQLSELQGKVQQNSDATAVLGQSVGRLKDEGEVDNAFAWGGFLGLSLAVQSRQPATAVAGTVEPGRSVGASFAPIFTYSWNNDWLAVAEVSADQSGVALTQAFIANTSCEHLVIAAGLMPVPFGTYSERYSPRWVNKFSEVPPIIYNGSIGLFTSDLSDYGIQARGVCDLGDNRSANWHVFAIQGANYPTPANNSLTPSPGPYDERLNFGSTTGPTNQIPTFGGRIGILPYPGAEIGVSVMGGEMAHVNIPDDTHSFVAWAVDAECRFYGTILRGEFVSLNQDASEGTRVRSHAAYLQASRHMRDLPGWAAGLEPVLRVGELHRSTIEDDSGNQLFPIKDAYEYGIGLNYYFTSFIRSSLIADRFNGEANQYSQVVLNTTLAF